MAQPGLQHGLQIKKDANAAAAISLLCIWEWVAELYVRSAAMARSFWNGFMISHAKTKSFTLEIPKTGTYMFSVSGQGCSGSVSFTCK